jgi:hypothetical protein
VLEETEGSLNNDVLEDGSTWDVDGLTFCGDDDDSTLKDDTAAEVDLSGDGEMVELDNLGCAWDARQEAGNLLEVAAELDERSRSNTVGVNH